MVVEGEGMALHNMRRREDERRDVRMEEVGQVWMILVWGQMYVCIYIILCLYGIEPCIEIYSMGVGYRVYLFVLECNTAVLLFYMHVGGISDLWHMRQTDIDINRHVDVLEIENAYIYIYI